MPGDVLASSYASFRLRVAEQISQTLADVLFLILSGVYLFYQAERSTSFYFVFPQQFEEHYWKILAVAAVLRLVILILHEPSGHRRELVLQVALAFLPAGVYSLSWRSVGYFFLLYLAIMTVGFIRMDYRRILWMFIVSVGGVVIPAILTALSGGIDNYVYANLRGLRSSWGICFPTDFASILLYLLMVVFVLLSGVYEVCFLPACLMVLGISWYIAISTTSVLCAGLFAAVLILLPWYRRSDDGRDSWYRRDQFLKRILPVVLPVLAGIAVIGLFLGARQDMLYQMINSITHERMAMSVSALLSYGVHPFGHAFEQIGEGGSAVFKEQYNFIDISYLLILLRYGWVTLLSMAVLWVTMTARAVRAGKIRLALVMGIIAFHSLSEHHFPEVNYNIFLVMAFADLICGGADRQLVPERRGWIRFGTILISAAGIFLLLPGILCLFRTVLKGYGYTGSGNRMLLVMVIFDLICVLCILLLYTFSNVLAGIIADRRVAVRDAALTGVCALCLMAGLFKVRDMVDKVALWLVPQQIEEELPDLTGIQASATGPFYIDRYPEVYARLLPGMDRSTYTGEDLARCKGSTILVDQTVDGRRFFEQGFLFWPIADTSAIYTDDAGVIQMLQSQGKTPTDYYSLPLQVDLLYEGWINALNWSEHGTLLLEGPERSLIYGPYVELYEGNYAVDYALRLPDTANVDPDARVVTLRVATYWGQMCPAEREIYGRDFDENGECLVSLPFYVYGGRATEFLAFVDEGMTLEVSEISYRHVVDAYAEP